MENINPENQRLYWIMLLDPTEEKMAELENILNPVVIKGLRHFGFWLFSCTFTLREIEDALEKSTKEDFYFIINDVTDNVTADKICGYIPSNHALGKFSKEFLYHFRKSEKFADEKTKIDDITRITQQIKEKGIESLSAEQKRFLDDLDNWKNC